MRQSYVLHILAAITIVFGYKLQNLPHKTQKGIARVNIDLLNFLYNTKLSENSVRMKREYHKRNRDKSFHSANHRNIKNFSNPIPMDFLYSDTGWQVIWNDDDLNTTNPTIFSTQKSIIDNLVNENIFLKNSDDKFLFNVINPETDQIKTTTDIAVKSTSKTYKTDAAMLNHIFDIYSRINKHHHHNHRYGTHFEDSTNIGNILNVTVRLGGTVYLDCRISSLQDKTVSWVKRKFTEDNLQLLTVGMHTYSGDSRYTVDFQYPNNWRLKIIEAYNLDEGIYECQISTHPPKVIQINLHINSPEVLIMDEQDTPLQDKYYEVNSTIHLSCVIRHVTMTSSVVLWLHNERILNYDILRGGISVKTDLMEEGANSSLTIAKVNKSDSGNYTCAINNEQYYIVAVHVLNESLAELYHGNANIVRTAIILIPIMLLLLSIITQLKLHT